MSARIRVASYNLRGLKDDAAAAAEVVRRIDPDVLLLQEVPRHLFSGWRIAAFARRCGLRWSGRTRRLSGTGMMTSARVDASKSVDRKLPVPLRANPRSYTTARVTVPGGLEITMVSVHLSLLADERLAHATRILDELAAGTSLAGGSTLAAEASPASAATPADGPFVLGGDLNESSQGQAWQVLGERLPQVTPERPTFPAAGPKHWIDAIFASAELTVLPHEDVVLEPDLLTAATDHLPVWVDLEVTP